MNPSGSYWKWLIPVSYTHLDVYKRQSLQVGLDVGLELGLGNGAHGAHGFGAALQQDDGGDEMCIRDSLYPAIPEQADVARGRVDRLRGSFGVLATMYTRDRDELLDPRISASKASDDVLAEFPPVTLMTAEYDYLRVQGEQCARRLLSLGVPVRAIRYEGCDHGFFEWPGVQMCIRDRYMTVYYSCTRYVASHVLPGRQIGRAHV